MTLANRDNADLGVGEHLLDGVNRAAGDSGAFEASQPLSRRLLKEPKGVGWGVRRENTNTF